MSAACLAYAEFEGFWERFAPETPFGRDDKDQRKFYTDPAELAAIWDRTEIALALLTELEADPVRLSRVAHHLKRLPRFPLAPRNLYSEVELFQFKKFLHNYTELMELLGPASRAAFGFSCRSGAFAQLLNTGRQSAESFYVADAYSEDLKAVREALRATDLAVTAERERRLLEIENRWDLHFAGRGFLLVARTVIGDLDQAATLLLVEPHDDCHWVVRPLRTAGELLLADQREQLLARERCLEDEVLTSLSHAARLEQEAFLEYQEVVRRFDLAFARARLAREWQLTRPVLAAGAVRIQQGRFIPCQETCKALGTTYLPLDAEFDTRVTAIFGSNMGGKTIVLKTLAFLQCCVQTGLFAPAALFSTRLFQHFHYVGEGAAKDCSQGLSGFGSEIRQFNAAWATCQEPSLLLFDEFARTTQSQEAEALLSAAMEALAARPQVLALFSTHFRGVRRCAEARFLRMRGLDRAALEQLQDPAPGQERIGLINRHMDYRLVADDGARSQSDALAVAALLGLDPAIAGRAETFFQLDH